MSPIDEALSQLVENFLPARPGEDPTIVQERHHDFEDRAHNALERYPHPEVVMDLQHVGDLIKRKLIRDNSTSDQAMRFSGLYTRLLASPVLKNRWAILKVLLELSRSPGSAGAGAARAQAAPVPTEEEEGSDEVFASAFSSQGLQRLPRRDARQSTGAGLVGGDLGAEWGGLGQGAGDGGLKPKAEILAERGDVTEPSENTLLAALPFTLLGLSSTSLPFKTPAEKANVPAGASAISIPATLPLPLVSLLHTLAEPALLYRSLNEYVQTSVEGASGGGLVGQSLRSAIGLELRGYVNLVGGLESEIRREAAAVERGKDARVTGVTLKRCVVWTREATMGLRLMSLIVDKTKDQKGGQLISTIHSFASSHGDPFVHAFAERLLSHITRPFYDMLRHWIYEGELTDPFLEFFVTESVPGELPECGVASKGASSVWEDKYAFHPPQVPAIITESFAKKVFLIGKSLNFIRHGCSDSEWVEEYSKSTSKELRYGDTAKLEMNIDEAYKTTMARLIGLMDSKFRIFDHLVALKKFLLLGQGDFVALLMESLSPNLERPANTLYRHNLTAQLEHAIRGSNAQFEDIDVLRRLDARMLEMSHGELGWDVFTLEYKIDAPVDVVVTPYGSKQYLKVFHFLWRIKRVEFALGTCWRRFMTGARGVLKAVADLVGKDWKITHCVVGEMVHFVNQLQYYILFEVIESSWNTLQTAIRKPGVTLDDMIEAHSRYLQNITHKGLLGSPSTRPGKKRTNADTGDESFLSQLHEILKTMLAYKDAVDGLYGYSVAEFTRRQERDARIEARTRKGEWGIRETDEDLTNASWSAEDQTLPNLRQRLVSLSSDFQGRVVVLLGDLAYQPDVDLRLLGVLLSFNEYYPVVNKKRTKERTGRGTPRTVVSGASNRTDPDETTSAGDTTNAA